MARLVLKGHDLGLDARAVARPHAFDHARVDRAAVKIGADDVVRVLIGIGEIAHRPVLGDGLGGKRKRLRLFIPRLQLHFVKIHRPGVDPRGRAGLKAPQRKPQLPQPSGQLHRRRQPVRARIPQHLAHDGASAEIGARSDHHRAAAPDCPCVRRDRADRAPLVHADIHDLGLLDAQVLLFFQRVFHHLLIAPPVGLRPQRVHRRPLAEIEHPVLDAGPVRSFSHLPAEGVKLPHQMALAGAADGGVAGHVSHAVKIDSKADRIHPKPRRGKGGLDPCVARPDHRDIAASGVVSYSLHRFRHPYHLLAAPCHPEHKRRVLAPPCGRSRESSGDSFSE